MADDKYAYGLGDLQQHAVNLRSSSGSERLAIRVWGGMLRFEVLKDKEYKAYFSKSIALNKMPILITGLNKMLRLQAGGKYPIVLSTWDKDQSKYVVDWVLTFIKDPTNVYHIEVQWKGNKCDFVMKGPSGVAYGSDPMSDEEKSTVEVEALLYFLINVVPAQLVLTNKRRVIPGQGASSTAGGGSDDVPDGEFRF